MGGEALVGKASLNEDIHWEAIFSRNSSRFHEKLVMADAAREFGKIFFVVLISML